MTGNIEANWAATGRKMQLSFDVTGTRGALSFNQERMNELLLYTADGSPDRHGFTRIESGPEHPPYQNFCPAGGHHIGFNDLKVIEVSELMAALVGKGAAYPDFEEAYQVQRTVDAVKESARNSQWVDVSKI